MVSVQEASWIAAALALASSYLYGSNHNRIAAALGLTAGVPYGYIMWQAEAWGLFAAQFVFAGISIFNFWKAHRHAYS